MNKGHRRGVRYSLFFSYGQGLFVALVGFAVAVWWIPTAEIAAASFQESQASKTEAPAASILDGVYTSRQASRGAKEFQQACASCHPLSEFAGRRFGAKWAGMSVGDLYDLLLTMPEGDPGGLESAAYTSIVAFFLEESGYPHGEQELPADLNALKKLRIVPLSP